MAPRTTRTGQAARATAGTQAIEVKVTVAERHEALALRKFGLERKAAELVQRVQVLPERTQELEARRIRLRAREHLAETRQIGECFVL
jgi:hypothetical protein